ncbi:MAG TPA: helix-turn-helix domain-containing protein, partial [Ignavibacteriaceae bacterium]
SRLTAVDLIGLQSETGLTKQETIDSLSNLEFLGIIEFSKADGKESISLTTPRVRSEELKLNYKLINELYISSRQKLDRMVDFVYKNDCRFSYILKYFGEDANTFKCGKCDNCLKQNGVMENSTSYIKEKIEDLLYEELYELTEKQISDILLGKSKNTEHKKSQHFNSLINYKREDISNAIRILVSENKIQQKSEGRNKIFFIINNNIEQPQISESVIAPNKSFEDNIELYHSLRELREKASKKFLQSANIICPDAVLAKISQQKPKTKSELFSIPGFNERMFNKVGNDFLELINSFETGKINTKEKVEIIIPQNILETYNLLQKKYSLQEIAKLRKLNEAVISMQIETIIGYLPETDVSSIISKDKMDLIFETYRKGIKGLKELKETLPKEFSYPQIRIALAKISRPSV